MQGLQKSIDELSESLDTVMARLRMAEEVCKAVGRNSDIVPVEILEHYARWGKLVYTK